MLRPERLVLFPLRLDWSFGPGRVLLHAWTVVFLRSGTPPRSALQPSLSRREVAKAIRVAAGKAVRYEELTPDEWRNELMAVAKAEGGEVNLRGIEHLVAQSVAHRADPMGLQLGTEEIDIVILSLDTETRRDSAGRRALLSSVDPQLRPKGPFRT
jgi:hypothetical protein